MSDPYGRPVLYYVRDRSHTIPGSPAGWWGFIQVGDQLWPTVENAEARPIPPGRCFGLVRMRADGEAPCLWLYWGDPDLGEEHQIHAANGAGDLQGCIAPGLFRTPDGAENSRRALGDIFAALVKAAAYGEFATDDGARVGYHDPPLGLVVIVEVGDE